MKKKANINLGLALIPSLGTSLEQLEKYTVQLMQAFGIFQVE